MFPKKIEFLRSYHLCYDSYSSPPSISMFISHPVFLEQSETRDVKAFSNQQPY